MYTNTINNDMFENIDFNVNYIVDNDYINYCEVLNPDDEYHNKVKEIYLADGLTDISCETYYSYIEAVDNPDNPELFLVRV